MAFVLRVQSSSQHIGLCIQILVTALNASLQQFYLNMLFAECIIRFPNWIWDCICCVILLFARYDRLWFRIYENDKRNRKLAGISLSVCPCDDKISKPALSYRHANMHSMHTSLWKRKAILRPYHRWRIFTSLAKVSVCLPNVTPSMCLHTQF